MGKKYIIELLDDCRSEFKGIMVFGVTQEKRISVELIPEESMTPYTEPDMEQVKADAYNDGYKAGREAENVRQKLKAYEQEKEEFHVGDEFENGSLKRFVILKMDGAEIDRYIDEEGKTYCMTHKYKVMRKTGRHFPEVAAVLEKMRESE